MRWEGFENQPRPMVSPQQLSKIRFSELVSESCLFPNVYKIDPCKQMSNFLMKDFVFKKILILCIN